MLENFRNRFKIKSTINCEIDKTIKQQSKLTLFSNHKSYTNYSSYSFKENEVVMDKAKFFGFDILVLSKLYMYETYYDEIQPYFV